MDTSLFNKIIFGPINSRRLGNSLGINLLPIENKFCNFNCIYCECGWTRNTIKEKLILANPKKIKDLNTYGLDKITPVKHLIGITEYNKEYLSAKRNWGHRLDEDDLQD